MFGWLDERWSKRKSEEYERERERGKESMIKSSFVFSVLSPSLPLPTTAKYFNVLPITS